MKAKGIAKTLALLLLMLSIQLATYPQSPLGFSYQAVVRDAAGAPLGGKTVGVRITLEDASHVAYYTESQSTQTNSQGVFSITIGAGTKIGDNLFESIPWANGDVFLKLELDPEGGANYTQIGNSTKLQAVPYALYAENVKEVNSLADATDTDPIFVVRNKTGQIVFAVYQSGVRIYVDDLSVKGAKGGFAVGGLTAKVPSDYFLITPDSARIKLNPVTKGAKGGFAVGGLTAKGGENYLQLTPDNYLIGHDAGKSITSGLYNSFMGFEAGKSNTSGSNNVFLGYKTGSLIGTGNNNVFIGNRTCESTTLSSQNVAIGNNSAFNVASSLTSSVIMGDNALTGMKTVIPVSNSLFIGKNAGINLGEGSTSVSNCIFLGTNAGDGIKNTEYLQIGDIVALGNGSGTNSDGYRNVFIGNGAGNGFVGHQNTMIGFLVGSQLGSGTYNVFLGDQCALNSIGDNNTYIGRTAGSWVRGDNNVFIGIDAGKAPFNNPRTESNRLRIGASNLIYGEFDNQRIAINATNPTQTLDVNGNVRIRSIGSGAYSGVVNRMADGTLTTSTSDVRLKENVNTLSNSLNNVLKLRGVSFTWKKDPQVGLKIGFIAQEVEQVLPELVFTNEVDGYKGINYAEISAVLVEAIKEQQQIIEKQQKQIDKQDQQYKELKDELDTIKALHKK